MLATVVELSGSGYRLPGAKMLMMENGDTFGTVSGGCLEADVLERAAKVRASGAASVFTYDTTADENSVFGLNMGCRGVVRILLETAVGAGEYLALFDEARGSRVAKFAATLISTGDNGETPIGGRIFGDANGELRQVNLPAFLAESAILKTKCERFRADGETSATKMIQLETGAYEFFFENIAPPLDLLIYGAGTDAIPLARLGGELGWQVRVADHRAAYLAAERFTTANELLLINDENPPSGIVTDERTAIVLMTHNYDRDRAVLAAALRSNAFYVGALGPKRRTESLLAELAASGESFDERAHANLFAPVGLDIGADTPESIALSIAAEIQAVFAGRAGSFLRERRGSIYGRDA